MNLKRSVASKKYWKNITKKERSERMSAIVSYRHANMTPEEKKKLGRSLQLALKKAKARKKKELAA